MNHTIYKGDSLTRITEIPDNSVHLTITSPPYYNAKQYNKETNNIGNNETYNDYLNKIKQLLIHLHRITVPGGIVAWNTSPVIDDGKRYWIPQDTDIIFKEVGFICRDDITWLKPDGAAKLRCGGWCQNKGKPLTWHPNITDEKIMVYKKDGKRVLGEFDNIRLHYSSIPKDLLTNVWKINPETHTTWHDAPFPDELVKRCVLLYSFKNDIVFDPFLGSGTTMKVAKELNRNSIGIELSDTYIEKAKHKIGFNQQNLFNKIKYELK